MLEFGIVNFGKVFLNAPPLFYLWVPATFKIYWEIHFSSFFPFAIDDDDGFALSVVSANVFAFGVVDDDDFVVAVVVSVVLLFLLFLMMVMVW